MKQKGKVWYDHKGQQVPSKYLPPYDVATEKAVSAILGIAEHLEKLLHSGKFDTDNLCQKAYTEYLKLNKPVTVYSFTNFDRSARVEFDVKNRWVRVYRATKENPGHKDYEMINLSFNAIVTTEAQGESLPTSPREELSGTILGEGANGVLLQGQDRSQDMPTMPEGREADSTMKPVFDHDRIKAQIEKLNSSVTKTVHGEEEAVKELIKKDDVPTETEQAEELLDWPGQEQTSLFTETK